jgi:hypothetical protein
MKTTRIAVTVASALFLAAITATPARSASAASIAQDPPGPPTPPNIVGGAGEGLLEKSGGRYLLRADDGSIVFELRDPKKLGVPHAALARHVGERISVTGVVLGKAQGASVLEVASLVVTRGGELDKVIDVITKLRCPDVTFMLRDGYRLDYLHTTADPQFQVYVKVGSASYLVWIKRTGNAFSVDSVYRSEGKVIVPVCIKP